MRSPVRVARSRASVRCASASPAQPSRTATCAAVRCSSRAPRRGRCRRRSGLRGLGVGHGGTEHHTGAMPRTQPHEDSGTGHGREGGQKLRAAGMDCGVRPRLAASVANSALPSGRAIPAATQLGEHRAQVAPREGVPGLVGVPVRLCGRSPASGGWRCVAPVRTMSLRTWRNLAWTASAISCAHPCCARYAVPAGPRSWCSFPHERRTPDRRVS